MRLLRSKWSFQLAVTAAFIGIVIWRVDVGDAASVLGKAHYLWAALALCLMSLAKFVDAARWQLLLARVRSLPLISLFGTFLVSNVTNNLLPMRVGDIARVQIVANRFGLPRAEVAATVFVVESVLDGLTFLVFLLIGLALLDVGFVPAPLLWGLAIVAGLGFLASLVASRFIPRDLAERRWLAFLPPRLRASMSELWPQFLDGLEGMRDYRLLAKAIALTVPAWLLEAVVFWVFGLAFDLGLSFGSYMALMVAANLVVAFPVTFWNLGTYEVVLLEIMVAWGVAREEAFAYALAIHILTNLWIVATGLAAIWLMRLSPSELFTLRKAAAAQPALPKGALPPLKG